MTIALKAPFPYFGGKSRIASLVWARFGDVRNYVEPFFGSGAVLLARPTPFDGAETVNDADGMVSNFWRALKADPDAVADHADWPTNENDLHARHAWLVGRKDSLQSRLEGDPDYFDAKVAGWWVWGMAVWIGGEFCSGKGPWQVTEADDGSRELVRLDGSEPGVRRRRVHLGLERGVHRQIIYMGGWGRGIHGDLARREGLISYFRALADRLRFVRVACGDWSRVMGPTPMLTHYKQHMPVGVFLDPPYADTAKRTSQIYRIDSEQVAHAVREWALEHGDDPRYRICLAGFEGEHEMPSTWECVQGKSGRGHGYGVMNKSGAYANAGRERLWFSPHCVPAVAQGTLL